MRTPLERFEELRRHFRSCIPSKKVGAARRRQIGHAANLAQVLDMANAEMACGASHDITSIDGLDAELRAVMAAARIQLPVR
jgi:uncharacterized protein with PhoU and TrkA domain